MVEKMNFPETLDEFIKQYSFIDDEKIYTNGSELIEVFRIKQWEEHQKEENDNLKNQQKEFVKYLENEIKRLKDLKKYAIEVFNNKSVINFDLAKKSIEEYRLLIAQSEVILAKYNEIIGGENE